MLKANALDQIAQCALIALVVAAGKVPVIGRARQACEPAQALHIAARTGYIPRHGFVDFDNADTGLRCAAGRSKAPKAFREIDVHLLAPHQLFELGDARVRLGECRALLVRRRQRLELPGARARPGLAVQPLRPVGLRRLGPVVQGFA